MVDEIRSKTPPRTAAVPLERFDALEARVTQLELFVRENVGSQPLSEATEHGDTVEENELPW